MKWNDRVDRICRQCGQHFTILAYRLKQGRGKFCSRHCVGEAIFAPFRGQKLSEETKTKISEKTKQQMQNPERIKACSDGMKRAWQDPEKKARMLENLSMAHKKTWQCPEFKTRMSEIHKELWYDPQFRAIMAVADSISAKKRWQDPEYRKHQIEAQRNSWQDTEIVAKRVAGLNKKPNKVELRLIEILDKYLPEFKYNGDFSLGVSLGGLIPDFVNVNGRKEVIEVLGDYWHSPEVIGDRWRRSELGKVMVYNSVGFKCLVIWESELRKLTDYEIAIT